MNSRGGVGAIRSCLVTLLLLVGGNAFATDYSVATGSKIQFLSKITFGSFVTRSDKLEGTAQYDEATSTIVAAHLAVKADTLDSGVSLRNKHMREKFLETAKFPEIQFEIENAKIGLTPDQDQTMEGTFTIKDVKKRMSIVVRIEKIQNDFLIVSAKFPLNISDFNIPQPKFAVVKMDPVLQFTVEMKLDRKA